MHNSFGIRLGRNRATWIVVLGAAFALGIWTLAWNPAASSAAPSTLTLGDPVTVSAQLEELHQRVVARYQAEEDNGYENGAPSWGHAITPEQAATIAQRLGRASGSATRIEQQVRNGRTVYAINMGVTTIYVDADLGTVVN